MARQIDNVSKRFKCFSFEDFFLITKKLYKKFNYRHFIEYKNQF